MKNIIIMCCVLLIVSVGVCNAQTKTRVGEVSFDTGGRGVVFKCVSPCDVLKGASCYVLDTGGRVINGVGTVITAPFKARWCFPRPKRYFYRPPQWRRIPGKLTPLPYPKPPLAPPPPEPDPIEGGFYRPLHYSPKGNVRVATN
jgi:hypothetical protein